MMGRGDLVLYRFIKFNTRDEMISKIVGLVQSKNLTQQLLLKTIDWYTAFIGPLIFQRLLIMEEKDQLIHLPFSPKDTVISGVCFWRTKAKKMKHCSLKWMTLKHSPDLNYREGGNFRICDFFQAFQFIIPPPPPQHMKNWKFRPLPLIFFFEGQVLCVQKLEWTYVTFSCCNISGVIANHDDLLIICHYVWH